MAVLHIATIIRPRASIATTVPLNKEFDYAAQLEQMVVGWSGGDGKRDGAPVKGPRPWGPIADV